jgi:hypothetical protein
MELQSVTLYLLDVEVRAAHRCAENAARKAF